MEVLALPNVEAVVITALAGVELDAHSKLPAEPTYPTAIVERIGGVPANDQVLDAPVIQVTCWGNHQSDARQLASDARAEIFALEGTTDEQFKTQVTAVESAGPILRNADTTGRERYIFSVRISATSTE